MALGTCLHPCSLIVVLNELDYPQFFYPKLAALTKTFLPKMETVYYIHNFKGLKGGTLFRFNFNILTY